MGNADDTDIVLADAASFRFSAPIYRLPYRHEFSVKARLPLVSSLDMLQSDDDIR